MCEGRLGEDSRGRGKGQGMAENHLVDVLAPAASVQRGALHRDGEAGCAALGSGGGTGQGDGDIYRSTDFGLTFTKVEMGSGLEQIHSLEYCGNGIVLAGTGNGTSDGDVYRSTDFGLTFTKIEMGADLEFILSFILESILMFLGPLDMIVIPSSFGVFNPGKQNPIKYFWSLDLIDDIVSAIVLLIDSD